MDKRFPDLPTVPMLATRLKRIDRKRWLVVLIVVGLLAILGIGIGVLGRISGTARSHTATASQATGTAAAAQTAQATSPATPLSTGTPTSAQATATTIAGQHTTPTPTPPLSNVSHGRPHLGGPFSDFVGAYGEPTPQGDSNSLNFLTGPNQSIDINVQRNEQGIVTQLNILGPNTWNTQQTQSYCVQFLPDHAVQFSATGNLIKYHSNSGDVVLNLQSPSTCLLSFT